MCFGNKAFLHMPACATLINLGIFQRQAAKPYKQATVITYRLPTGLIINKAAEITQNMGNNHLCCSKAVCVHRFHIAANAIHKAVNLTLGMMEAACTGPAITACKNALITLFSFYAGQLICNKRQCIRPRDFNEAVFATLAFASIKPAFTNHRGGYARGRIQRTY